MFWGGCLRASRSEGSGSSFGYKAIKVSESVQGLRSTMCCCRMLPFWYGKPSRPVVATWYSIIREHTTAPRVVLRVVLVAMVLIKSCAHSDHDVDFIATHGNQSGSPCSLTGIRLRATKAAWAECAAFYSPKNCRMSASWATSMLSARWFHLAGSSHTGIVI